MSPEFEVKPGDTVRWWTQEGFATGHYVRHSRKGKPVVVPVGNKSEKYVDDIYPVNDGKMVAKRGHVRVEGYNAEAPARKTRRR